MKQQNLSSRDINNKQVIIDDKDNKPLIEVNFQGIFFQISSTISKGSLRIQKD